MQHSNFEDEVVSDLVSHMKDEVSEEKKFSHRRAFIKKMLVAAVGIGVANESLAVTESGCGGCNTFTNSCADYNTCQSGHTCGTNVCNGQNVCQSGNTCDANECVNDTCSSNNLCTVDRCQADVCHVDACSGNTCGRNHCDGDRNSCDRNNRCGEDRCTKDDECLINECDFDIECPFLDTSCRLKNKCNVSDK